MWSEISVWLEFAFLWWFMIFSSCTYWPCICLLWKYLSCFLILCFVLFFWTRILPKWLIVPSLKYSGCFNSRFLRFGHGSCRTSCLNLYTMPMTICHLVLALELYYLPQVHFSRWSNHRDIILCISHWNTSFHLSSYFLCLVQNYLFLTS